MLLTPTTTISTLLLCCAAHLAYGSAYPPTRPEISFSKAQDANCLGIEISHVDAIRDVQVEKRAVGAEWVSVLVGDSSKQSTGLVINGKEVQVIATRARVGEMVGGGYFRLSLQHKGKLPLRVEDQVTTGFIPHDAGAQEMKDALQSLSNVDEVQVRRSGPDAQGGYQWTVTFLSPHDNDPFAGANIPLLTVYMQNIDLPLRAGAMEPVVVYEDHDAGEQWESQTCSQSPCVLQMCRLAWSAGYQFRARVLTRADGVWSQMSFPSSIGRTLNAASGFTLDAPILSSATERSIAVRVRVPIGTMAHVQYRDVRTPWYWQDAPNSDSASGVSTTNQVLAVATGLTPGRTYEFRAKTMGVEPPRWSTSSLPMKTTAPYLDELPVPEAAQVVASTIGDQSLKLSWKPVLGATGYSIQKTEVFLQDVVTYDAPEGYQKWEDVVSEQADSNYVIDGASAYVQEISTRVDSQVSIASGGFILATFQQGLVATTPFLPYNADASDLQNALEQLGMSATSVQRHGPSSRFEYTWRVIFAKEPTQLTLYFENITKAATYSGPGQSVFIRTLQQGQPGTVDDHRAQTPGATVHSLRPNTRYQFRILARNDFDGRVSLWSDPTPTIRTLPEDVEVSSNRQTSRSTSATEEENTLSSNATLADFDVKAYSNFSSAWVEVTWYHPASISALLPAIAIMLERSDGVASAQFISLPVVENFFQPFIDFDVVPLSAYAYRVRVVSADGVLGDPSPPAQVTVPALQQRSWEQRWPQRPNVFISETGLIRAANKSEQEQVASNVVGDVKQLHQSNDTQDGYKDAWKPSARFGHSLDAVGAHLYMYGGYKEGEDCSFSLDAINGKSCRTPSGPTDETWRLHLESRTWERVRSGSPLPPSRYLHATRAHGSKVYMFGGLLNGPDLSSGDGSDPVEEVDVTNGTVTQMRFSEDQGHAPELHSEAANDLWCLSTPELRVERKEANVTAESKAARFSFPTDAKTMCIKTLSITLTVQHRCPSQLQLSLTASTDSDLRSGPTSDVIFDPAKTTTTCYGGAHRSDNDTYTVRVATDVETSEGFNVHGLSRYIGGRLGGTWLLTMVDSVQDDLGGSLVSASMEAHAVECKQSHSWTKLSDGMGPSKRYGHGAIVANGALWIFGGSSPEHGSLDDLWRFDLSTHDWALVANDARTQHNLGDATVLTSHGLLRLNGLHGDLTLSQPLGLELEEATKEELPALRGSLRMFAGLSVLDNHAVVVGGHNGISAEDDIWILPFFQPIRNHAYCSWQQALEPTTRAQSRCSLESVNTTLDSACTIPHLYSLALCESHLYI